MRRMLVVFASLALMLALTAPRADAITGGKPDGDGHPNVGALLGTIDDGESYYLVCSGSLLSDEESSRRRTARRGRCSGSPRRTCS